MAFQPKGWGSPLRSGLGKGSEGSLGIGQWFSGWAKRKVAWMPQGGSGAAHRGVRHPLLSVHTLHPRHTVVLSPQRLRNKVSANKGPFHELQAGPLSATKKAIETGSQENSLL